MRRNTLCQTSPTTKREPYHILWVFSIKLKRIYTGSRHEVVLKIIEKEMQKQKEIESINSTTKFILPRPNTQDHSNSHMKNDFSQAMLLPHLWKFNDSSLSRVSTEGIRELHLIKGNVYQFPPTISSPLCCYPYKECNSLGALVHQVLSQKKVRSLKPLKA